MTVGMRIKKQRELIGLSQIELANKIGVSKQTLYKYENNIVTNIPSDKIEAIAKILRITPACLMGWEEPSPIEHDVFDELLAETEWYYESYSHCEENPDCPLTDNERISMWVDGVEYAVCEKCKYNSGYYYLTNGKKYYKFEEKEFNALSSCLKPYLLFRINEAISKKNVLSEYEYKLAEGLAIPQIQEAYYTKAAHNDHAAEPGEAEKMKNDVRNLKRPE